MRAAAYVGRVGGLAVALGIGVATGGLGVASAAPVDSDSSTSADSAASTDSGAQAPAPRSRTARSSRPARDVGGDHGARGAVTAPSVAAVTGDRQDSGAAIGSAAGVERVVSALLPRSARSVMTRRVDLPSVSAPSTFSAPAIAQSVVGGLVSSVVPAAVVDVPQMVATPPQAAAAGVVEAVWSPLLGSSPGGPTQSPVSWMVLAVARREFDQQRTTSAPAAVVATGQVLSPAAAVTAAAVTSTPGLASAVTPTWSPSPLAQIAKVFVGLLLSLGGMNTSTTNPTNPIQQFLYSLAKGINDTFDPAPPAGSPTVSTPNLDTGTVTGTTGFPSGSGLRFTTTQPATGLVAVASDGTYMYTPTLAARQAASGTTTDSFIATVRQGLSMSSVTITVPVDPGTPLAGAPAVGGPNVNTGVVTGGAVFTDTAGRTLTYSTLATSTGGGSVTVNPTTGVYTYTPTQSQRQAATGSTTDTFTVMANNGVRTTSQTVTVAVDAGIPVSGTPTVDTPSAKTGVVTGGAVFTDTAGRTLTYSTLATSTGGGSVTVNPTTGVYTYTPTQSQRLEASQGATDTFKITADNGVRTATQTVTVSIIKPSVTARVTVGTNAKAIAVSPDGKRLYVTNLDGDSISVIDTATNQVTATISDTINRPLNIAISPSGKTAYIVNYYGGNVSVIDTGTNTVTKTIGVGNGPQAIAASPDGKTVYVANTDFGTLSVIDAVTNTVSATVDLGKNADGLAFSPDSSRLYFSTAVDGTVSVLDIATNTATASTYVGRFPYSLVVAPDGKHAYVVDFTQKVMEIDTSTNTNSRTIRGNAMEPLDIAISPDGTHLFVSNRLSISVINTATGTIVNDLPVTERTQDIAVNPIDGSIYITNGFNNNVSVISL
jgi:YVTN family beta-propeller protein/VCBS repeat-containing protein